MSSNTNCAIHTTEQLTHYCMQDEAPICAQCILTLHAGHTMHTLSQYCEQVIKSEEWRQLSDSKHMQHVKHKIESIVKQRKQIHESFIEYFKNINTCFDRWNEEAELVTKEFKKTNKKIEKLTKFYNQNETLQFAITYSKLHEIINCNLIQENITENITQCINKTLHEFEKGVREIIVCSNPSSSAKYKISKGACDSLINADMENDSQNKDDILQIIELSRKFERNFDFSLSLEYLYKAKEKFDYGQLQKNSSMYLNLMNQIAYTIYKMGDITKSIEILNPIINSEDYPCIYQEVRAESYSMLGRFYYSKRDYELCISYTLKAIAIYKSDSYEAIQAYIYASIAYFKLNKQTETNQCLGKAIELHSSTNLDPIKKASILNLLGVMFRETKSFTKSLDYHNQAYDILLQYYGTQEDTDIALTFKYIGKTYYEINTPNESNDSFQNLTNGLEILKRISNGWNIEVVEFNFLLGKVFLKRMNYQKAFEYCNIALKMIKDICKVETLLLADIEQTVGEINIRLQRYDKGISNCNSSIEIRKTLSCSDIYASATCHHFIGLSNLFLERFDEAIQSINLAFQMFKETCGDSSCECANEMLTLGQIYISVKKYDEALAVLLDSLNIKKKINETSKDVAEVCDYIAISYHMINKYTIAIQFFNKSYLIKQVRYAGHDQTTCLNNIIGKALAHHERGDFEDALELYKKGILIHEDMIRSQTIEQAMLLNNIGCLQRVMGKLDDAVSNVSKSLKILNEIAPISIYVSHCFENLGNIYFDKKDFNLCINYWNQAMELRSKIVGEKSIEMAESYINLSHYYKYSKQYDKSEVNLLKALNLYQCLQRSNRTEVSQVFYCLALLRKEMGDMNSYADYLKGAKEMLTGYESEKPVMCKQIYGQLAQYFSSIKKYGDACEMLERLVLKCYDPSTKSKSEIEELSSVYQSIACLCNKKKDYAKAISFMQKAYESIGKEYGELNYLTAKCVFFLGKEYMLLPNYEQAKECFEKAMKVFLHIYGKDSPYCNKISQHIEQCQKCIDKKRLEISILLSKAKNNKLAPIIEVDEHDLPYKPHAESSKDVSNAAQENAKESYFSDAEDSTHKQLTLSSHAKCIINEHEIIIDAANQKENEQIYKMPPEQKLQHEDKAKLTSQLFKINN